MKFIQPIWRQCRNTSTVNLNQSQCNLVPDSEYARAENTESTNTPHIQYICQMQINDNILSTRSIIFLLGCTTMVWNLFNSFVHWLTIDTPFRNWQFFQHSNNEIIQFRKSLTKISFFNSRYKYSKTFSANRIVHGLVFGGTCFGLWNVECRWLCNILW